MAYYLSMDGVDDRVRMPSMSFDEVILDCYVEHKTATLQHYFDARVGKGNSQVYRNTSNQDAVGNASAFTSLSIDGVTVTFTGVTFTPTVPTNQRTVIRAVYSTTTADDLDVFVDRAFTGYEKGRIYSVTMKLAGSTVAYYDMTLGNVQDQSGNGKHATLTGGTWVSDGGSGTPGSTAYATKQIINQTSSVAYATKQTISQSGSIIAATGQTLSQIGSANLATKQSIYAIGSVFYTSQQTITDGGIPGSTSYATKQAVHTISNVSVATKQSLYQSGAANYITKQAIYSAGFFVMPLKQVIFHIGTDQSATKQTIVRSSSVIVPLKVSLYQSGATPFPLTQILFDPDLSIIGKVRLKGRQDLRVYLVGRRDLTVRLRGGIEVTAENQKFKMTAGDSKIIEVSIEDMTDLTGITAKYAMKKSIYNAAFDVYKDTISGITVDIANKQLVITLLPADTQDLSGEYLHEAEITDQAGNVSTIMTGIVTIKRSGV